MILRIDSIARVPAMTTPPVNLTTRHRPRTFSDGVAFSFTKVATFFADTFFAKRYGHRAVVLETIAAVPGMVGATLQHLKALRRMRGDGGWIHILMDEAENERMHLMTFIEIAKPTLLERWLILIAQGVFYNSFFLLYLVSSRTAHRMVGYFEEEEAIISYTDYLAEIESGRIENVAAPQIAIDYWKLAPDARLKDVVIAVRADEASHRDVNHGFADEITHSRKGSETSTVEVSKQPPVKAISQSSIGSELQG